MEEYTNYVANIRATNFPLPSYCHMPVIFSLQFPFTVSNICCHLFARKGISELPPLCMMKWQTERSQREPHQQLFTLCFLLTSFSLKFIPHMLGGMCNHKDIHDSCFRIWNHSNSLQSKRFSLPLNCMPPLQKAYLYSLALDQTQVTGPFVKPSPNINILFFSSSHCQSLPNI